MSRKGLHALTDQENVNTGNPGAQQGIQLARVSRSKLTALFLCLKLFLARPPVKIKLVPRVGRRLVWSGLWPNEI